MHEIDKEKVKKHFSQSASTYDQYAVLQREMGEMLLQKMRGQKIHPQTILDIGCGTGCLTLSLAQIYPQAEIIGLDFAEGMILYAQNKLNGQKVKFEIGDGETLSYPENFFDLIISNAALQWMNPSLAYSEFARVLKAKGHLYFTTFGPQTLQELGELGFATHQFLSRENCQQFLQERFFPVKIISQKILKTYPHLKELINFLKKTGAQSSFKKTDQGLSPKSKGENLNSPLSVSFEIIFGSAQKGEHYRAI